MIGSRSSKWRSIEIPEPAEGIDPRQSTTEGQERPLIIVKQRGELEAGAIGIVSVRLSRGSGTPALILSSRGSARIRTDARALPRQCCGLLREAASVATGPREAIPSSAARASSSLPKHHSLANGAAHDRVGEALQPPHQFSSDGGCGGRPLLDPVDQPARKLLTQAIRFSSRGGVEGHAATQQRERRQSGKRTGSRSLTDGARSQPTWKERVGKAVAPAGIKPGPRETNQPSDDGLGIHEPGSMTWGGRLATPAPSGRARDRAMCPAVIRFNEAGRAL